MALVVKYFKQVMLGLCFISPSVWCAPQWVEAPPVRDGYIIAIGLGEDIKEAKHSAVTELGSTLYSNVSSQALIQSESSNDKVSQKASFKSLVQSDNVLLPTVTWENIEADKGIYYAMAVVKLQDLVELYNKNLDFTLKPFNNLLNKESLTLNDYLYIVVNQKGLEVSAQRASAVSVYSDKAKSYFADIALLFKKQNQFIGSVCFNVKKSQNRLNDKVYLPAIESAVQADKFELKNSPQCTPISYIAKTEKTGNMIVSVTMQVNIGEPSAISNIIKFTGKSAGSYKSAMLDAADNFSNYFKKHSGFLNTLLSGADKPINIE